MSNNKFPNHTQCINVLSSDRSGMPNNLCMIFLKKQLRRRQDMKTIITEFKVKKTYTSQWHTCITHGLYEETWFISWFIHGLYQDIRDYQDTWQRLFMLLATLISRIVLTETFFDIINSFKVKSSFAKINFLLKTNTLDISKTEKVTKIIHKLNFNQN